MKSRRHNVGIGRALGVLGALIALGSSGFSSAQPGAAQPPKAGAGPAAKAPTPQLPPYTKLRYDSLLSVNDRCAVRKGHLNQNIRPVYVNRQPVGFC